MKIIIIGASGVIGYQLFLTFKSRGKKVIGTYSNNKKKGLKKFYILSDRINKFVKINEEDIVILLTAISNPTFGYKNPNISKNINIVATKKIIDDLKIIGCKLYFMSSVEVFDGRKGNYSENSLPNPLNLYGKQKFYIEKYIKKNLKNYCIMRTSFIVGKDPNQRCPVKLTYDTLLQPEAKMAKDNFFAITSVEDLCKIIFILIFNKKLSDLKICHLSSKERISRVNLANDVLKFSKHGFKMNFKNTLFKFIKYTEPRGRQNNLISINPILNQYKYQKARLVIQRKIKIIDKNNETSYSK